MGCCISDCRHTWWRERQNRSTLNCAGAADPGVAPVASQGRHWPALSCYWSPGTLVSSKRLPEMPSAHVVHGKLNGKGLKGGVVWNNMKLGQYNRTNATLTCLPAPNTTTTPSRLMPSPKKSSPVPPNPAMIPPTAGRNRALQAPLL